jgi:glutamine synthetase
MQNSKKYLQKVSENFCSGTFFVPVVGAEIEFYLIGQVPENIISIISNACAAAELPIFDVKKEEGNGQYEVSLLHINNPVLLADRICQLTRLINNTAETLNLKSDFSAKPFPGDYGNAMHIHVSILGKNGNNILQKNGDDESLPMLHTLGGLLETMQDSMQYFAPYAACYERLGHGKDAPSTISWGGNNRTVAIRLPTTTADPHNRRIEHRVATADADPHLVIAAILSGIEYGLNNKITPKSEKIYGDASLDIYGLVRL